MRYQFQSLTLALLSLANSVFAENSYDFTVKVSAGDFDLTAGTVVSFDSPQSLGLPHPVSSNGGDTETSCYLSIDEKVILVQQERVTTGATQFYFLLEAPLEANQSRSYSFSQSAAGDTNEDSPLPEEVICTDNGRELVLAMGDRTILRYQHAVNEAPEGLEPYYRRSGYIHPLYTPKGKEITGDFPPDHAHQHALFFAWTNTEFQGRKLDFWNQADGTGKIEHVEVMETVSGPVFGGFTVKLRHSDVSGPGREPIPVLEETWTVRAYRQAEGFLIDLESVQQCAGEVPLTIKDYHYGAMAIRGNYQWFDEANAAAINKLVKKNTNPDALAKVEKRFDFLTSEGMNWANGNATRARWVAMHGKLDGEPAGVTVLSHPDNFRAPQPVRLHPSKPYFCFAPMALGEFLISPGEPYVSRYRYHVYDGPVDSEKEETLWRDYANPPIVKVVVP